MEAVAQPIETLMKSFPGCSHTDCSIENDGCPGYEALCTEDNCVNWRALAKVPGFSSLDMNSMIIPYISPDYWMLVDKLRPRKMRRNRRRQVPNFDLNQLTPSEMRHIYVETNAFIDKIMPTISTFTVDAMNRWAETNAVSNQHVSREFAFSLLLAGQETFELYFAKKGGYTVPRCECYETLHGLFG